MIPRREFITLLGGAAAWPLATRAQQGNRVRRIGVLTGRDENDPLTQTYVSAFIQALADAGWTQGRNVRMYFRAAGGDIDRIRVYAQELVGLQPDIVLANSVPVTIALQRETRTIPIVFAAGGDPVASGLVERLDRPSGNITGFGTLESVLKLDQGLQSFRNMRRMEASFKNARALRLRFSQSLARRRQRLSQAIVRSTIQRLGNCTNPLA